MPSNIEILKIRKFRPKVGPLTPYKPPFNPINRPWDPSRSIELEEIYILVDLELHNIWRHPHIQFFYADSHGHNEKVTAPKKGVITEKLDLEKNIKKTSKPKLVLRVLPSYLEGRELQNRKIEKIKVFDFL